MMTPRSKYEHFLTAGLPIFIAVIGGAMAMLANATKHVDREVLKMFFALFLLQCVGLTLLVLSKVSSIKKGRFFDFGPANLRPKERIMYYAGYSALVLSLALEAFYAFRLTHAS